MNKIKKAFLFTVLFASALYSQSTRGISRHGAAFLGISPHARQVAMGDAFTGLANDISVLRYNIGGLGNLRKPMGGLSFHNWIDDTQQGALVGTLPTRYGVLGFDFHYLNEGSIYELDESFTPTGNYAESNDISLTMGYGRYFNFKGRGLSVGSGVRVVRQNLADYTATAVGLDLGAVFEARYISLGLTIQNLGLTKFEFNTQNETLPETYRAGLGINIPDGKIFDFNIATDLAYTTGQDIRYYAGGEVILSDLLALRSGYRFQEWEASRWSAGFGLLIPMEWLAGSQTRLDYTYSPLDAFEASAHRFSLVFSFGEFQSDISEISKTELQTIQIYEEQRMRRMSDKMKEELEAAKLAREAAEQARIAAEEAEKRTRKLEMELKIRLEKIQEIARQSQGKIEVAPVEKDKIQVTMRIHFDFDSAVIRPEEQGTVAQVAQILNTYPESRVFMAGHTDNIGTEEYNIRLSERRVRSVVSFLSARESVSFNRFYMPIGYGEMQPIATNATEAGRHQNRRVDFMLYTRDARPEMPEGSALRDVLAVNDSTVHIIANGKVKFSHHSLDNPARIVVDFPGILLLFDIPEFTINKGIFTKARVAFHPRERYSRVVLDLSRPASYSIEAIENYVKIQIKK